MNDQDVVNNVVVWLKELTGLTVIQNHEGGDRPPKPYLMVNLTNIDEVRVNAITNKISEIEVDGVMCVESAPVIETEWVISVHSYGEYHTPPLRKIRSYALNREATKIRLSQGLDLFDTGGIKVLPEFINAEWERRANIKIQVRGFTCDGLLIDSIEESQSTIFKQL